MLFFCKSSQLLSLLVLVSAWIMTAKSIQNFFCGTEGMITHCKAIFWCLLLGTWQVIFLLLAIKFHFFFHIIIFVLCVADIQWSKALFFDGWLGIPWGFLFFWMWVYSFLGKVLHFWSGKFVSLGKWHFLLIWHRWFYCLYFLVR